MRCAYAARVAPLAPWLTRCAPHHLAQNGLAWDSLHFLRIAQCGYETEKSYAFFPLLPGVMRGLQATGAPSQRPVYACQADSDVWHACAVLHWALPALYPRCTLALAGFLVSNTAFVFAALVLYWRVLMRS